MFADPVAGNQLYIFMFYFNIYVEMAFVILTERPIYNLQIAIPSPIKVQR